MTTEARYETHRFTVAGRMFGLEIDRGTEGVDGLPPVAPSIVWYEVLNTEPLNCGNTRQVLFRETAS